MTNKFFFSGIAEQNPQEASSSKESEFRVNDLSGPEAELQAVPLDLAKSNIRHDGATADPKKTITEGIVTILPFCIQYATIIRWSLHVLNRKKREKH